MRENTKGFWQALAILCAVSSIMWALVSFMHMLQEPAPTLVPPPSYLATERWVIYVRFQGVHNGPVWRTLTYNAATYRSEVECELVRHSSMLRELLDDAQQIAKEDFGPDAEAISFCGMQM